MPDEKIQSVLIIEDHKNVTHKLQARLRALPDCEVNIAYNDLDAFDHFSKGRVDLFIASHRLPHGFSPDIVSRVRQEYPQTAIIIHRLRK